MPRRFPIFQFPNRAADRGDSRRKPSHSPPTARHRAELGFVCKGAVLVWAYDEISDGANWFRRLLGIAGGAGALVTIARLARAHR